MLVGDGDAIFGPVLQSALVVERQVIGWFSVKHPDPNCCTPSGKFPVFLLQDEEDCWYGFPQFGHNGLKIGKFDRKNNAVAHPSQLDRRVLPRDEQVYMRPWSGPNLDSVHRQFDGFVYRSIIAA